MGPSLFFFLLGLYFLPSILAWKKRNHTAIAWLNILLGWTVVGWVVAFIWALTKEPNPVQAMEPANLCAGCGKYSSPGVKYCPHCGAQAST